MAAVTTLALGAGTVAGAVGASTMTACATGGVNTTHLHEMNVQVKNNLNEPTALTIYAVNASGSRRLGDVPANDSVLLKWVPPDADGSYRLIAERQSERPIRSQPFSVGKNLGTITWTLVPNILSFNEPDIIDTVNVDSASAR
jgi:hypothetical protein